MPRLKEPIPPPGHWKADRPADLRPGGQPHGAKFGSPGPDQGYALTLARRYEARLVLADGEHKEDVVAGCLGVATKRSSLFGRAPVIFPPGVGFPSWGFPGPPAGFSRGFPKPLVGGPPPSLLGSPPHLRPRPRRDAAAEAAAGARPPAGV